MSELLPAIAATLLVVLLLAIAWIAVLRTKNKRSAQRAMEAEGQVAALRDVEERYRGVMDIEAAIRELTEQRDALASSFEQETRQVAQHRAHIHAEIQRLLHQQFHDRRVNLVNERKEFFQVGLDQVAKVVREHHGEIEFTMLAEAAEYRQTLAQRRPHSGLEVAAPSGAPAPAPLAVTN